jgi:hypothetical protein
MTSARFALSAVGLLALTTSSAFAQNLPPTLISCAIERKDSTRLACFDREVARLVQQSAGVAPTPSTPVAPAPLPPPVAAAPPVSASANSEEFGLSGDMARKRREEREKDAPAPAELRAAVTKVSTKPYGEYVLELDNGQVWEQPEKKNSFSIKQGEGVRITRGALGSFFLTTDAGATTKVRRIR